VVPAKDLILEPRVQLLLPSIGPTVLRVQELPLDRVFAACSSALVLAACISVLVSWLVP
jgi:hypothetical protein